jgi:hypothetical protein
MATIPCVCTSDLCQHNGERCGEPVAVVFKGSVMIGDSKFGNEYETGICEKCWATAIKHFPDLFRNPRLEG